ncbi:MAG: hypothetical protein EOO06_00940 [Chitinophagaceae bacterium]|nr:MAG: hypothetical protein EOO06_00940 [Chitinophagaceae bacterium]
MKTADKVRILAPTFESMFPVGSEHFVHSCEGDFIYLIDPFYAGTDSDEGMWPFLESELEKAE